MVLTLDGFDQAEMTALRAIWTEEPAMSHKAYNGHRNRNAWNVALWIFNDEGNYRLAQEAVRQFTKNGRTSLDDSAAYMLARLPAKTPDGVPYTLTNIRLALRDWQG